MTCFENLCVAMFASQGQERLAGPPLTDDSLDDEYHDLQVRVGPGIRA